MNPVFGADGIDGELGSLLELGLEEEAAVHFCIHSFAFSLRCSLVTSRIRYNRHLSIAIDLSRKTQRAVLRFKP